MGRMDGLNGGLKMFKVGDIVKYTEKWSTEAERKYRFKVLETDFCGDRIKIGCLNSKLALGSVSVVDKEMIELA